MTERDDDRFRPKLRPPRDRGNGEPVRFVSRVLKAASRSGPAAARGSWRPGVLRGRGVVAARLAMARSRSGQRRVIVKVRVLRLGPTGLKSSRTHLRYLDRAGVILAQHFQSKLAWPYARVPMKMAYAARRLMNWVAGEPCDTIDRQAWLCCVSRSLRGSAMERKVATAGAPIQVTGTATYNEG